MIDYTIPGLNVHDVLTNIKTNKYSKSEILRCLAYFEAKDKRHILDQIAEQYFPDFYNKHEEKGYKFMTISFIIHYGLN